jgi:hypothetical protein
VAYSFPFLSLFVPILSTFSGATTNSTEGPSKCFHLLVNLACAQDDADIVSKEVVRSIPLQDPLSSEECDESLEWCHKLPVIKHVFFSFWENKMS